MTEIESAIWSKYNSDVALKAVLTGGFHNTEAPQNAQMPYGVFQIISAVPRLTFSEDQENVLVQIKLFSDKKSSSELNGMFSAIENTFKFKTLTLTDYTGILCTRLGAIKSKFEDVWQYTISYLFLIEKNVSVR